MKTRQILQGPSFQFPSRRGFTLIELLVVIAIIAILAAILFPVFAQAREKARAIACISNQKQIGLALLQYVQDSDEVQPYYFYGQDGGPSTAAGVAGDRYKWMDAIYPYIKSEQVFNCPSDSFPITAKDGSGQINHGYHYRAGTDYGSYLMNTVYRYDASPGGTRTPPSGRYINMPVSIAQVAAPSTTIWIGDTTLAPSNGGMGANFGWSCLSASIAGFPCSTQPSPIISTNVTPNQIDRLVARHQGRVNVIYCDGHAKSVTLGLLSTDLASDGKTLRQFTIEDD